MDNYKIIMYMDFVLKKVFFFFLSLAPQSNLLFDAVANKMNKKINYKLPSLTNFYPKGYFQR